MSATSPANPRKRGLPGNEISPTRFAVEQKCGAAHASCAGWVSEGSQGKGNSHAQERCCPQRARRRVRRGGYDNTGVGRRSDRDRRRQRRRGVRRLCQRRADQALRGHRRRPAGAVGNARAARPGRSAASSRSTSRRAAPATSGSSTRTAACRSSRAPASSSAASSSAPAAAAITPNPLQRGGLDVTNDSVYVAHPCANSILRLQLSNLQTMATASLTAPKGVSAQLYGTAPADTVASTSRGRRPTGRRAAQPERLLAAGHEVHAGADRRLRRRLRRAVRDRHGERPHPPLRLRRQRVPHARRPGLGRRQAQRPDGVRRLRAVLRPRRQPLHRRLRQQPHPALELLRLHVLGRGRRRRRRAAPRRAGAGQHRPAADQRNGRRRADA